MSREIKFRMYYYDKYTKKNEFAYFNAYDEFCDDSWCELNPKDLEQYTGLKDKNGEEIYEGDIVEIRGIKYYVDFEHGGFWFNNDNLKFKANIPFTHFQEINDVVVIGNIHENKEWEDG